MKREPKRTRIIAVHFELLVRGAGVKQGPLISTAVHCLRASSNQRDQEPCLRSSRQIVLCITRCKLLNSYLDIRK